MRALRVAAAVLLALFAVGCDRGPVGPTVIADPPEAFYPHEFVALGHTGTWGDFRFYVASVSGSVGGDVADIDLTVKVGYTNLSTEAKDPPGEMRFEFDGRAYPAAPHGQLRIPDGGYVDGPIPAGSTADGLITGTLDGVGDVDPPSDEEMHDFVVRSRLVIGAPGTNEAIFPFTEPEPG